MNGTGKSKKQQIQAELEPNVLRTKQKSGLKLNREFTIITMLPKLISVQTIPRYFSASVAAKL